MSDQLEKLMTRLLAHAEAKDHARINRVFEIRFVGDERSWVLDLTAKQASMLPGPAAAATGVCGLGFHPEDLEALLNGEAKLKILFMNGRMRVFGNVADAMKLEAMFP
jgi:hypothetical protein